jgi:hypothetical protein
MSLSRMVLLTVVLVGACSGAGADLTTPDAALDGAVDAPQYGPESGGTGGAGGVVDVGGISTVTGTGGAPATGGTSTAASGGITGSGGVTTSGGVTSSGGVTTSGGIDGGGIDGGGRVACSNSGNSLSAADVNNYAFADAFTFPVVKVKPMTELTFDWSGVTADFRGHAVDPRKDLTLISVFMWKLTVADLQTKLNADTLAQRDLVVVPFTLTPDGANTSARLFSFTLVGDTAVDPATLLSYFDADFYRPNDNYTYMVTAATGNTLGQGVKMIQAFQLDPTSTNTEVKLTTSSTRLAWSANLHNLVPTGIPAGKANITLDWDHVSRTALGGSFDPASITRVLVGHYAQPPAELERSFLDLELIATDLYQGELSTGTRVSLNQLTTRGGKAFSGIDATGTWLLALQCGSCRNPAPWYLSVLKTCQ